MIHEKFKDLIQNEGCIGLIIGDIRFGKSVLGYGLLEYFSKEYNRKAYIFGLPNEKTHLLPEFIKPIFETKDIEEDSIVLFDEAYISFYSRKSMSDLNKMMDILAGLVGQKDIMAIYITQQTRRLEIGIVSSVNWLAFKKPSLLQSIFDRRELRTVIKGVYDRFDSLIPPENMTKKDYQKRCTYIMTGDCVDMIENSNTPPEWWKEELSEIYKGIALDSKRNNDYIEQNGKWKKEGKGGSYSGWYKERKK